MTAFAPTMMSERRASQSATDCTTPSHPPPVGAGNRVRSLWLLHFGIVIAGESALALAPAMMMPITHVSAEHSPRAMGLCIA